MRDELIIAGAAAVVLVPSIGIGVAVARAVMASRSESSWPAMVGAIAGLLAFAASAAAIGAFVLWLMCSGMRL